MHLSTFTALTAAAALAGALPASAGAAAPSCKTQHWIGAWAASPTDSGRGTTTLDAAIAAIMPSPDIDNSTVRAVLTPTYGGTRLRVRLSNRFGPDALTFKHVTIAHQASGAAVVPSTLRQVTFRGRPSVRVPAGKDIISDPVRLKFRAFQTLAVSVHVPESVGKGTRHAVARQTSYVTATGAGDAASDTAGTPFTQSTTTRPFVTGIDVRAPRSAGAVVALGSSLTDGAQNQPNGVMQSQDGMDQNVRYTDWLGRRLREARRPLSVLNAGISGNRILQDGSYGSGGITAFGPSTLDRLDADVIRQSGVTTVIIWMGINDISQSPRAEPEAVIAGFKELIARLQKANIRVVQATLSPFKGYPPTAAQDEEDEEARRVAVNEWIRTQSTADAVVDFDRVVRDPADPTRLNPQYDSSDHLHLNAEGYKAVAAAVPLRQLALPKCRKAPASKSAR